MLLYKPSLTMYIWSKQEYWHYFLQWHSHSNQKCSEKLDLLIQFNFHYWILVFFITKIISVNLHIIFKDVCEIWNNLLYVVFVDTVIINLQEIVDIIFIFFFIYYLCNGWSLNRQLNIYVVKKWQRTFSVNYRIRKRIIVNLAFSIFVTFI